MNTRETKLKIHDESEFFSPMDPDQSMISDEVIAYLSRVFLNKHRRLRESFVLRIISDETVNEDHIRNMIREEFDRQKDDIRYATRRLMLKMIVLAALGAAILCLWLYFSATRETVGVEILSILSWVCVWEATSIAVLQRPELRRMWFNIERLTRAEIVFETAKQQSQTAAANQPGASDETEA